MSGPGSVEGMLESVRDDGWRVACHNDYIVTGKMRTFWLFTHPAGLWAKGEGDTDREAIGLAMAQMKERFKTP